MNELRHLRTAGAYLTHEHILACPCAFGYGSGCRASHRAADGVSTLPGFHPSRGLSGAKQFENAMMPKGLLS